MKESGEIKRVVQDGIRGLDAVHFETLDGFDHGHPYPVKTQFREVEGTDKKDFVVEGSLGKTREMQDPAQPARLGGIILEVIVSVNVIFFQRLAFANDIPQLIEGGNRFPQNQ